MKPPNLLTMNLEMTSPKPIPCIFKLTGSSLALPYNLNNLF